MPIGDEREAISRLKQGDINGLEVLVRMYQVKAIRTAHLITRDLSLAEDVVQTAFIRVYDRSNQFDSERPFEPWFLRIVVNDALKAVRRRRRELAASQTPVLHEASLLDLIADSTPTPEEQIERSDAQRAVWEALGQLTPRQRAAVVLRYYAGLKETQVAEQLTSTVGTIKRLLHVARKRLRSILMPLR